MSYKADYYQIPTGIDRELAEHIKRIVPAHGSERQISMIGDAKQGIGVMDKKRRDSAQRWLPTDGWIAGMMAHYIAEANDKFYKFDLTGWSDQIQYTEYNGKGKHYNWHSDTTDSVLRLDCVRKLSISLLLSDPDEYEGGEFQIMFPGELNMLTMRPPLGTAIIFPSYASHRVRPLKSGNRVSLVGWYGGPPFR